ncbi:peptidoglycan-associated lipoprotein Pal [Pseudoroseicyclus sp. CXY001]|uniref:peptidoglycan-associated lipoprotein Pal n=1 Tax=Pseudoroseicyclus sp. CXY001 TaxID=3242492 RepID=UPI003570C638
MRYLSIVLMVAALALSACTRPDRFGGAGDGMGPGGPGAGGVGTGVIPGGPGDPNSPEYFNQVVGDRVFFAVDQSTLSDAAKATLDGQAGWLQSHPEFIAVIEGHADEQGTREYNVALGARRANAAREYLISRGINPARLRTVSYGKERPVAVCSDEACYTQNRRAVTVIAAGALS